MYVKRVFRLFIFAALCLFIVSMNDREVEASLKDIPTNSSEEINYLIGKRLLMDTLMELFVRRQK